MELLPNDMILEIFTQLSPDFKYFRATCTRINVIFEQNRAKLEKRDCKLILWNTYYRAQLFTNNLYKNTYFVISQYDGNIIYNSYVIEQKNDCTEDKLIEIPEFGGSSCMFMVKAEIGNRCHIQNGHSIDYDFSENKVRYIRINKLKTSIVSYVNLEKLILPWELTPEFYEYVLKYFIIGTKLEKKLEPKFRAMIDTLPKFYQKYKFAGVMPSSP